MNENAIEQLSLDIRDHIEQPVTQSWVQDYIR